MRPSGPPTLYRRWLVRGSIAWGCAFLLDAVLRVVFAYTLPVDAVPGLSIAVLVVLLAIAHGSVMLYGRRHGVSALMKAPPVGARSSGGSGSE